MSSVKIGIVGLPNVGKSTLFNALVNSSVAVASNYPFCTIEPNVGIVDIPDSKLPKLAEVVHAAKIVPAAIEFVDIAGLVSGASQGQGLGNKFLSHIREVDAIILVLRAFNDSNIINTQNSVDPERDAKIIDLELMLADLETLTKRRDSIQKDVRSGNADAKILAGAIEKAIASLEKETPLRNLIAPHPNPLLKEEREQLNQLSLLTLKPLMRVLNVGEDDIGHGSPIRNASLPVEDDKRGQEREYGEIRVSAKIESEIAQLSPEEAREYMQEMGMKVSGLDAISKQAYALLGLQSYYTAGEKEARAWTIRKGSTASQAAGVIHGDFERGFIAAEIMNYNDFIQLGGWSGGKAAGKVRTEGKSYVMQPDDIALFRFNV